MKLRPPDAVDSIITTVRLGVTEDLPSGRHSLPESLWNRRQRHGSRSMRDAHHEPGITKRPRRHYGDAPGLLLAIRPGNDGTENVLSFFADAARQDGSRIRGASRLAAQGPECEEL